MGGCQVPDWEALKKGASCEEEKEYINHVIAQFEKWKQAGIGYGFAYNMVYVMRQKCGHFEIFQSPNNEYHHTEDILKQAEEHAAKNNCSRCICKR